MRLVSWVMQFGGFKKATSTHKLGTRLRSVRVGHFLKAAVILAVVAVVVFGVFILLNLLALYNPEGGFLIENRTDQRLNIFVDGEEEVFAGGVDPHSTTITGFSCRSDQVARTEDGELVDRWSGRDDCSDRDPWIIYPPSDG